MADSTSWDYLILSAANADQARVFETQLQVRARLGRLDQFTHHLVVADPPGCRIGSGGSTVACLLRVLERELSGMTVDRANPQVWQDILSERRILLIHAGGDSRRLPAYGPAGKVFVPIPGESMSPLPETLFDRQLATYADWLQPRLVGQLLIVAGDVVLDMPADTVQFSPGVCGLACEVDLEQASRHGVFVVADDADGSGNKPVERFLQKPAGQEQRDAGAIDSHGRSLLDTGVLNLDASAMCQLLRACAVQPKSDGTLCWTGPLAATIETQGFDVYREFCCILGRLTDRDTHARSAIAAGSRWPESLLNQFFNTLSSLDFHVAVPMVCRFLHLGTPRQLLEDGACLVRKREHFSAAGTPDEELFPIEDRLLKINNRFTMGGSVVPENAAVWLEACRVAAPLHISGENVIVGIDVDEPLTLARGMCLDVLPGHNRAGVAVHFVRCYHIDDLFNRRVEADGKGESADKATFCGRPVLDWLTTVGAQSTDVWHAETASDERWLWTARLFPAEPTSPNHSRWLWMFAPEKATAEQHGDWLTADRYSLAEIADLADHAAYTTRRLQLRAESLVERSADLFVCDSRHSASDLAFLLEESAQPADVVGQLLANLREAGGGREANASSETGWRTSRQNQVASACVSLFDEARLLHRLGSAVRMINEQCLTDRSCAESAPSNLAAVVSAVCEGVAGAPAIAIEEPGVADERGDAEELSRKLENAAFVSVRETIVESAPCDLLSTEPRIRRDEIVWGRSPVRLDLGGGWTDTPPYALEFGGCVLNAAVTLNNRFPIQVYARLIDEPLLRLRSIDQGQGVDVVDVAGLLDYQNPAAEFSLTKAAIAQCCCLPTRTTGRRRAFGDVLGQLGGGLEVTTLAALPKGSGLGTSSIIGSVMLAVLYRVLGHKLSLRELFHATLRLEQSLTTGGGWQDQVGGVVGGVKRITTLPGLVPDPQVEPVSGHLLDPQYNDGRTLLYYTGVTRLAKDILSKVVGRYLDAEPTALRTLADLRQIPHDFVSAIHADDFEGFGRLVGRSWELNKRLDPSSSNDEVEALLERVSPHVWGAKLLGAGGGGFLLLICKSIEGAEHVKRDLSEQPPNDLARFADFAVSPEGLTVEVL